MSVDEKMFPALYAQEKLSDARRVSVVLRCADCGRDLENASHMRVVVDEQVQAFCCCEGCVEVDDEEDDD